MITTLSDTPWLALLENRWQALQQLISQAPCLGQPVRVIAVSKYASLEQIQAAYLAGIRDFGENKVQDALTKQEALRQWLDGRPEPHWHLIGSLQKNKVMKAVGAFKMVHSIDSLPLAQKISDRAETLGIQQPVLLQVNMTGEASKSGWATDELLQIVETIGQLPGLAIHGLMTIAREGDPQSRLRQTFSETRHLRDQLVRQTGLSLLELSMGMSDDYLQAIAEGATMVRIGRFLFGQPRLGESGLLSDSSG